MKSIMLMTTILIALSARTIRAADVWKVQPRVEIKVREFDLPDVRLLDGPFKHAMEMDQKWLLKLEPDRLLSGFRSEAGLKPKAPKYPGWESAGVAGSILGHYLSACSMMYASTGDHQFLDRVNYIVHELAICQEANGNGYVAAIPDGKRIFAEIARGEIRSQGFDLNGGWVPWYTMHKVMAGLRDAYLHCGNNEAKDVLIRLSDWALATTDKLDDAKIQQMLLCEQGGMKEVAADVYAITGDPKYLTLADRFTHKAILDPLAAQRDELAGKHANTQIPKLVGCAREYELTGNDYFKNAAIFFWHAVVEHHSYVTGGNSSGEHFGPPDAIASRLSDTTTETCNTYNMLKLTEHLYQWTGDPQYMDYFERALINHILASQDPATGRVCYYVPLRTGSEKQYQTLFESFTCCCGTGMENHSKYGQSIYAHDDSTLFVNLFIASELNWTSKGVHVRMETRFPDDGAVDLHVDSDAPIQMPIKVRWPAWCPQIAVSVNGQKQSIDDKPVEYIAVDRTWTKGDVIHVELNMPLHTESPPDDVHKIALLKGPVLLAGEIADKADPGLLPAIVTDSRAITESVHPVKDAELMFTTSGIGKPTDVTFVPFFQKSSGHYGVYWDVFSTGDWTKREANYRADQKRTAELEARTIDRLNLGEMQPERDHQLQSDKSQVGDFMDHKWRHCWDGGFIEFKMKVTPGQKTELVCTYWGSDSGDREFDVLVNGQKVGTEKLENNRPGSFFDVTYPIAANASQGADAVIVRFQPLPGKMAGGFYGCRTVRPE